MSTEVYSGAFDVAGGPEQETKLRELAALAGMAFCEYVVWPDPAKGEGAVTFHAWTSNPEGFGGLDQYTDLDDPIGVAFDSYRCLVPEEVERIAAELPEAPRCGFSYGGCG